MYPSSSPSAAYTAVGGWGSCDFRSRRLGAESATATTHPTASSPPISSEHTPIRAVIITTRRTGCPRWARRWRLRSRRVIERCGGKDAAALQRERRRTTDRVYLAWCFCSAVRAPAAGCQTRGRDRRDEARRGPAPAPPLAPHAGCARRVESPVDLAAGGLRLRSLGGARVRPGARDRRIRSLRSHGPVRLLRQPARRP